MGVESSIVLDCRKLSAVERRTGGGWWLFSCLFAPRSFPVEWGVPGTRENLDFPGVLLCHPVLGLLRLEATCIT